MRLHNLTGHNQAGLAALDLAKHGISEVEEAPRLKPVNDPADFNELKDIVKGAVQNLRPGDAVLVGGLGQFQSLIQQLPYKIFFANYNPTERRTEGLIPFEPFTRQEIYEIENQEDSPKDAI